MMLSGLGPAAHLAEHGIGVVADLPGVGQDLQDHMGGCPVSATLRHPERFGTPVRDFAEAVEEFEATGRGLLATHYLDAGAFLRLDPADPDPDFEALFVPGLPSSTARTARPSAHGSIWRLPLAAAEPGHRGARVRQPARSAADRPELLCRARRPGAGRQVRAAPHGDPRREAVRGRAAGHRRSRAP